MEKKHFWWGSREGNHSGPPKKVLYRGNATLFVNQVYLNSPMPNIYF
jgi:hypothetical protein